MKKIVSHSRDYAFRCHHCKGVNFVALPDGTICCGYEMCEAIYAFGIRGLESGWICINEEELEQKNHEDDDGNNEITVEEFCEDL